jgi:hypothetical protein
MTVHVLHDQPSPELSQALVEFDARFSYPLGPGRCFRISHSDDYPRFFRSMGDARCFVAERGGRVIGSLAVAIRTISVHDGGHRQAAYIGDLKVDPAAGGSLTFLRLAQAADAWARPQVSAAYGVVMDGTRASPADYTGRIGIPSFLVLGKIMVLRLPTASDAPDGCPTASVADGEACHRALSRDGYCPLGGDPVGRSQIDPCWLVHPDGLACGRLEDTRAAKRLIASDREEMQSAHLAFFAWKTPGAAADLLHSARSRAAALGLPALFVAVPERDLAALNSALGPIDKVVAPATIYGAGLPADSTWHVNSSEI